MHINTLIFTLDLRFIESHSKPFVDMRRICDGNEIGTRPGYAMTIDLLFMLYLPKTYERTKRTFTCSFAGLQPKSPDIL